MYEDNKNIIVSSQIINLTGNPFNMYEEVTGDKLTLIVSKEKLPEKPVRRWPPTFYVVPEEEIDALHKRGRTLNDIAYVCDTGKGADGKTISHLASAKDPRIRIKLKRRWISPYDEHRELPYVDESGLYIRIA